MSRPSVKYRVTLMPLRLKSLLTRHAISQVDLGAAVIQTSGAPMEKTGMNLLLNWGEWPKKTPEFSIKSQVEAFLRARGIPDAEIATAWETDDGVTSLPPGRRGHPDKKLSVVAPAAAASTPEEDSLLLEPVMLKQAAKRHFKLTFDPFGHEPQSSAEVYQGEEQRYVLASLQEAIANTRMVALVGESGSGKSTLWAYMRDQIDSAGQSVRIIQPISTALTVGADRDQRSRKQTGSAVLHSIIRTLDPAAKFRSGGEAMTEQAHELLAEKVSAGQRCVLVFEEGHDLSIAAIKQLKRFHEFKLGAFKRLLSIILLAQPELIRTLNRAGGEAREVANRMEIVRMLPLENELEAYVAHRLARGNAKPDQIFAPDALDMVRNLLVGDRDGQTVPMSYPLLVGNLLTRAMNIAAEIGAPRVDGAIVRDAKKRGD